MLHKWKLRSFQLYPWIAIYFFSQGLFFQFEPIPKIYQITSSPSLSDPIELTDSESPTEEEFPVRIREGIWKRLTILTQSQELLQQPMVPQEANLESTIESLDRAVFGQRFLLGLSLFSVLLVFGSWVGLQQKVWFSLPLLRAIHWVSLVFLLQDVVLAVHFSFYQPLWGICLTLVLLCFLGIFALSYWHLRGLKAEFQKRPESFAYIRLRNLGTTEEGETETTSKSYSKSKVLFHFLVIIGIGILLGNLVYIPLFLLQKHYFAEFGVLLGCLMVLLSIFYIRNYSIIASEGDLSFWKKAWIGFSYLQYRFLRNTLLILGITLGIGIFVSVLFSLLVWNTELLQNNSSGWIEKNTEF